MKKLSKAQEKVLNEAKAKIDLARKYDTFEEYFDNTKASYFPMYCNTAQKCKENNPENFEMYKEWWEKEREAIVLTSCNSRTLVKLQEFGLIEIIKDSNGQVYGIDTIKVLNY